MKTAWRTGMIIIKGKSNWSMDEDGNVWEYSEYDHGTYGGWSCNYIARKLIVTGHNSPSEKWARRFIQQINEQLPDNPPT